MIQIVCLGFVRANCTTYYLRPYLLCIHTLKLKSKLKCTNLIKYVYLYNIQWSFYDAVMGGVFKPSCIRDRRINDNNVEVVIIQQNISNLPSSLQYFSAWL